jgi:glycosyltransferase involved in cell wall biosynthesis
VIVVDDCSSDDTAGEARAAGAEVVIRQERNQGVGAAIRTGLLEARRRGIEFAAVLSGDDQHEPDELPRIQAEDNVFEDVELPCRYDYIVLTHVLEHLDEPVRILRRIGSEWLTERGRLFLVCPNANAPSRQIAVMMGLIEHNAAVTEAEAQHGHRVTYSFDTLERDVVAAGLEVVLRSGIFFKALANFQWDRLLETDIISRAYLDGCYELGQKYPDLSASIFLLCRR